MITAPVELATRPQWVAWKLVEREGEPRPTKLPYNARTGRLASTTDPKTWTSFEEAAAFYGRNGWVSGIGYVLSPDDPYVGIDLDHCRHDGQIEPWALEVVRRLNSYTEVSPSGTGLRIFVRGELPPYGRRKGQIEIYSQARFLTITGQVVPGCPETIQDRAAELAAWHLEVFGSPPEPRQNGHVPRSPVNLADADILIKARAAKNGAAFWALWNGDWSGYDSRSNADLALLNHLSFWTGPDPSRLDSLFQSSGLMREKWERASYRDPTISKALEGKTEFYEGAGPRLDLNGYVGSQSQAINAGESAWMSLGDLVRSAPDPGRQLVEGVIWEARTHWIYSSPGAGKTLFILAALMHMAAGRSFCGRPVVQGPVCIIEEDSPNSVISEYVQMLADVYEFDLDALPFWINKIRGVRITDEQGRNAVQGLIDNAPQKPLVVAFDACERIVPSDRFNSRELEPLSQLFQGNLAAGIANVMIDHTRKPGGSEDKPDPIDLLYGGRTKSAISDVMMFFSGAIKAQAHVSFPKFRGEEPASFVVSFDGASGFTIKEGKAKISETERIVMRVMNNSHGRLLSVSEVAEEAHLSDKTAQRSLARLVDLGWVERDGTARSTRYKAASEAQGPFQ